MHSVKPITSEPQVGPLFFKFCKVFQVCKVSRSTLHRSVQGFGKKPSMDGGYVYPGSGATCDTDAELAKREPEAAETDPSAEDEAASGEVPPEDPDVEFKTIPGHHPPSTGPRVINVGIPGPGLTSSLLLSGSWESYFRLKVAISPPPGS